MKILALAFALAALVIGPSLAESESHGQPILAPYVWPAPPIIRPHSGLYAAYLHGFFLRGYQPRYRDNSYGHWHDHYVYLPSENQAVGPFNHWHAR